MKMTLPAREFACGWLNTAVASGTDRGRPQLHGTVLVESFGNEAVQLVAADGSMLLSTTVGSVASDPSGVGLPSLDEAPDESRVVIDTDGRMKALMGFVLRDAKAAEKEGDEPPPLTVEVRSGETPGIPTLSPDLDRQVMVVTTERERLELPLYEGGFIAWRPLLAGHEPAPTEVVAFAAPLLARLGKLRDTQSYVSFTLAGPDGAAVFTVEAEPLLRGVLMPVHTPAPVPG